MSADLITRAHTAGYSEADIARATMAAVRAFMDALPAAPHVEVQPPVVEAPAPVAKTGRKTDTDGEGPPYSEEELEALLQRWPAMTAAGKADISGAMLARAGRMMKGQDIRKKHFLANKPEIIAFFDTNVHHWLDGERPLHPDRFRATAAGGGGK
jgi:hypothetical protein